MKLLIHDLSENEWSKVAQDYAGWKVISDNGTIRPCAGCFGCWLRTPGECVIKDGYDRMGALIHEADEMVVMSRYTYGGFSRFVKNVMDRSIGLVLPYFEIKEGEMHHKKRYPEDKAATFIIRGKELSPEDKTDAKAYVEAVCRNFHATIKDIRFEDEEDNSPAKADDPKENPITAGKTVLLNGSPRGDNANSKRFLETLSGFIEGEKEIINISAYQNNSDELVAVLTDCERIVLAFPMYVDGIPSPLIGIMEKLRSAATGGKKIYAVVNMGFYESRQIKNVLKQIRNWCGLCGYSYCGGVAVGAGEMMGQLIKVINAPGGPVKYVFEALRTLGDAISRSASIEDIYADAYRFPRAAYIFMAHSGWRKSCKNNGVKKKDLLRQV